MFLDAPLRKLFNHSGIDVNQLTVEEMEEIAKSDEYQEYAEFERKKTERQNNRRSGTRSGERENVTISKGQTMDPIVENSLKPPSIPQHTTSLSQPSPPRPPSSFKPSGVSSVSPTPGLYHTNGLL